MAWMLFRSRWMHGLACRRIAVSRAFAFVMLMLLGLAEGIFVGTLTEALLHAAGTLLVGVAVIGRLWCALFIAGHKGGRLVTEGPYSLLRNPLYLFSSLGFVGLALAAGMLTLVVLVVVFVALLYPAVIASEERALRQRFGAAFDSYLARTRRLVPRWQRVVEPARYLVSPRHFRRAMSDVVWFPAALSAVELLRALHSLHYLRPLLRLP